MAKAREKSSHSATLEQTGDKKLKEPKEKNGDALVGRVKKVVKKSRRKLSEQKFEKELQRTITFLEQLRAKIAAPHDGQPVELAPADEPPGKAAKPRAGKKNKKKDAAQTVVASTAQSEAPPLGD